MFSNYIYLLTIYPCVPLLKFSPFLIITFLLFIFQEMRQYEITAQNKLHMFWQIPQYLFFTMGEAMLVPTALEFAYTQSPLSMKTLMTAAFFLIETFGSITVGTIRQIYPFKNQVLNFNINVMSHLY
jgi:dipeptide/tripeptide permease